MRLLQFVLDNEPWCRRQCVRRLFGWRKIEVDDLFNETILDILLYNDVDIPDEFPRNYFRRAFFCSMGRAFLNLLRHTGTRVHEHVPGVGRKLVATERDMPRDPVTGEPVFVPIAGETPFQVAEALDSFERLSYMLCPKHRAALWLVMDHHRPTSKIESKRHSNRVKKARKAARDALESIGFGPVGQAHEEVRYGYREGKDSVPPFGESEFVGSDVLVRKFSSDVLERFS